jgi:hypothetical protein
MFEATQLQQFFRDNPELCPHDYRFSVDKLKKAYRSFGEADSLYPVCCLFIDVFSELRARLRTLKIFGEHDRDLATDCITIANRDSVIAFKEQHKPPPNLDSQGTREFISILSHRAVTTAAGDALNLDESFPAIADTLQTILDALPHLTHNKDQQKYGADVAEIREDEISIFGLLSNAYRIVAAKNLRK